MHGTNKRTARMFALSDFIQARRFGVTPQDIVNGLPDWYEGAELGAYVLNTRARQLYRDLKVLQDLRPIVRHGNIYSWIGMSK